MMAVRAHSSEPIALITTDTPRSSIFGTAAMAAGEPPVMTAVAAPTSEPMTAAKDVTGEQMKSPPIMAAPAAVLSARNTCGNSRRCSSGAYESNPHNDRIAPVLSGMNGCAK